MRWSSSTNITQLAQTKHSDWTEADHDIELCSSLCEPKMSIIIGHWTGEGLI